MCPTIQRLGSKSRQPDEGSLRTKRFIEWMNELNELNE